MKVRYDPLFLSKLKKLDIRVRKTYKEKFALFIQDPFYPQLNNHALKRKWTGYRSIDIIADYRVIYREVVEGDEMVAVISAIGTHKELYET